MSQKLKDLGKDQGQKYKTKIKRLRKGFFLENDQLTVKVNERIYFDFCFCILLG